MNEEGLTARELRVLVLRLQDSGVGYFSKSVWLVGDAGLRRGSNGRLVREQPSNQNIGVRCQVGVWIHLLHTAQIERITP